MAQDIKKSREEALAYKNDIEKILADIKVLYLELDNDSSDEEKIGMYQKINQKYNELFGTDGTTGKIKELRDFFDIAIDGAESYKAQIEDFFDGNQNTKAFEIRKENFAQLEKAVFGENLGTPEELPGLEAKLKELFSSNDKKYNDFYSKIEKELTGGATSVNLAKTFSDRVNSYNRERALWSAFLVLGGMYLVKIGLGDFKETSDWITVGLNFLQHLPIYLIIGWVGFFASSRQAESRKLEEAYRHKEVMARAYFGYKDTISDIDSNDGELAKKHMENLLNAMREDSSKFLSHNGEKHPVADAFTKILDKSGGKISIGDFTIENK